jgi:hypothetical protein|tara:strand:- start:2291 stop:2434 length:144 start_codon:yes stop_codon:yes gene_type:complete
MRKWVRYSEKAAEAFRYYIGSAVELLISKSFFAMSQVRYAVTVSVVF